MFSIMENKEAKGSIIVKKRGKRRYYYYVRSYRVKLDPDAEGKTRGTGKSKVVSNQTYLGTAEDVLSKLSAQSEIQEPVEIQSKPFGLPVALFEMAERIGLRDAINSVAPNSVQGISVGDFALIAAINRVGNHTSKEQMGRWYQKTDLSRIQKVDGSRLSSKSFWYAFDHLVSEKQIKEEKASRGLAPNEKMDIDELEAILDDSKIEAIEKQLWTNLSKEFGFLLDVVLYDTTNFYHFFQPQTPNALGQFGKNKQHRDDKRQVGLQLALLKDLGIPIFHNVYCGHQNDATLFPTAIRVLLSRYQEVSQGTERLVLVFDKGNNSRNNISLLEKEQIPLDFVGSLTPSHHRDLLRVPLKRFETGAKGHLEYRTEKEVFGAKRTILITYNPARAAREEKAFEKKMQHISKEARAYFEKVAGESTREAHAHMETFLRTQKVGTSQALRFFDLTVSHNGWCNRLQLRRKRSEVQLKKASFGKKILFTSIHDASNEDIASYYNGAPQIEDAFHHLKDRDLVSYGPAYHWTDSKIRVHAFVCVLALLLLKLLQFTARENGLEMSTKVLVGELKDITMVILIYSADLKKQKAVRKVSTLSTVQKQLFDLFNLHRYT
jgi:transposase